jgi:hypothetical protein
MAGKMRSPNYPALSLAQTLEAADKLWKAEKRTPVSNETAAVALGYKSLSGPARVAIGALRQYGLIDKAEKGHIRLSDLAVAALHGNADEKQAALRRAAVNPALFKELAQHHMDASDAAIRSYLITKKDFAEDGAKKAAKAFRDTLKLAKPEASGYTNIKSDQEPEFMASVRLGENGDVIAETLDKNRDSGILSLTVPYGSQGHQLSVQVRLAGERLKRSHIAKVRRYLEIAEEDLENGGAD